ncbi:SelT/SelW/SelH family protein [Neiella marina]|uniref:SelT/SelW/SelH family protein n=1 Tax=Neiella holothuriorum TaxID=2870530 RepID=A0ABS7EKM4_9GAMM|nr:SelT/SelW/SelH family protein [Neiella holothuriorum]MBW8192825.1 SelT/SelW/SelH family protein [Neiella holothuriorum]
MTEQHQASPTWTVRIRYCTGCRWMMRAAWTAQELLTTFENELEEVALGPGRKGQFDVWLNDALVWSRKREGGFPELKVLKQRLRDVMNPERDLGHSDTP